MTTQEQAHIVGFIKRAAQYNVGETEALEIYKSGSVTGNILKALVSKIPGALGVAEHAAAVAPGVQDALAAGARRLANTGSKAVDYAVPRAVGEVAKGAFSDVPMGVRAANLLGQTYKKFKPQAGAALGDTAGNVFQAATEGLHPRLRQHLGLEYYAGMHDKINPMVSRKADQVVRAMQRMLRPSPVPVPPRVP